MANAAPNEGGLDIPVPKYAPWSAPPYTPTGPWTGTPYAPAPPPPPDNTPRTRPPIKDLNPAGHWDMGESGSTMPAFNPDAWNTDSGIADAQGQANSIQKQIDDWLSAAASQAIIGFGDPALASMAGFGIDPQAADFARQNYLSGNSTLSRLDKSHDLARKAVIDRLAAHGILGSGDLGYGETQADQSYGNQVYDARTALLSMLRGAQQQALTGKNNALGLVSSAKEQAQNRALNKYNADIAAWIASHSGTS